jgi:DNA-binding response OmpR family regulator
MLEWMELALGRHGVACMCATTPDAAIKIAENDAPSIVFTDIDLPDTDLKAYLDLFRENESTREAPLYVMSGVWHDLPADLEASGLLHKPFPVQEVLELLPETLRENKTVASSQAIS